MASNITDTGIRGFLKWFQEQQPGLYAKVAPQISAAVPTAFSDYHAGGWRTAGLTQSQAIDKLGSLRSLGDDSLTSADFAPSAPGVDLSFSASDLTAPQTVDVSTAANDGTSSTSVTNLISSIVGGISSLYMTKQQANIQQQVVNTQLARAAAGLPPLPTSIANLGVPQVSVGLSSGTGGALAIAGVVGLVLFMVAGRKRA